MRPHAIKFDHSKSLTKQSFKDETNINKIMAKFQKTGALSHYASHAPEYGEHTHIELQDALNVVADANTMFEELPSTIRDKFANNPGLFLDFVQDPKNLPEMEELGLASASVKTEAKPQPSPPVKSPPPEASETPSAPPKT